jgi:hypothetical protein
MMLGLGNGIIFLNLFFLIKKVFIRKVMIKIIEKK